eukprot:390851_1
MAQVLLLLSLIYSYVVNIHSQSITCNQSQPCVNQMMHCNQTTDCIINCFGSNSCSSSTIILYPTVHLILQCYTPPGWVSTCIGLNITTNAIATISSANITCSTYAANILLVNVDEINFNCAGYNLYEGCDEAQIDIKNANYLSFNCYNYGVCYLTQLNVTNISRVDNICSSSHSCGYTEINTDMVSNMNILCQDTSSCFQTKLNLRCNDVSMNLSCFMDDPYSYNISCGDGGCDSISIDTEYNNYVKHFVYIPPASGSNNIYINCYSPTHDDIFIHRTIMENVGTDPFSCNDDICCPSEPPKLQNIRCQEGVPCQVYCGETENYTGCGIINASQAISLDLQCENCIISSIICPAMENSTCTVSCSGNNYDNLGCIAATMTAGNNSYVSLECLQKGSCSNMMVDASFVQHISIKCIDCSELRMIVPNTFNSADIQCLSAGSCDLLSIAILHEDYEFSFANISCDDSFDTCGEIQLYCDTIVSSMQVYGKGNIGGHRSICSDWNCCPLTHEYINCHTFDEDGDCVMNCAGNDYKSLYDSDASLCAAQYIYGANKINCFGYNACNYMTTYSNDTLEIFCNSQIANVVTDFCQNMNLYLGQRDTNIICHGDSCENMSIYSNDVISQQLTVSINYCEECDDAN